MNDNDRGGTKHLFKAVGFGIIRFGTPLLPIAAIVAGVWAYSHGGLSAAWPAIPGFLTAIPALGSIPELDGRMKHHWSMYRYAPTDT